MGRRNRIGEEPAVAPEITPAVGVETAPDSAELRSPAPTVSAHRTTEQRVDAIESTMAALIFSTFAARDSVGKPLSRCRCGLFATRATHIDHPVAGIQIEHLCGGCKPASPLATEGVPQRDAPLLAPADMAHVVKVNRNLEQARTWGAS